ncbi:Peroxisomal membrane protein PMP34 [Armadillidium vulgare]|nr:Peroxisomal membrane protein PMP34 [Armadillidium vulgare]
MYRFGLYRGLLPVIQSLYCSNFVYFYTFHALKSMSNREKSAVKNLLLGMIAGCINVLATTPLWVVNTRIKMQGTASRMNKDSKPKYKGLLHGLLRIWKEEGVSSLWSGTLSSLILVINPAIQFMTYEAVKNKVEKTSGGQLSVMAAFLSGALAKAIATIITYPLQLIQTKQRHGHNYVGLDEKAGIISMTMYIIRLQGARGLFKGLEAKILQTVLTAALMFVFYEKIAAFVFKMLLMNNSPKLKH